MRLLYAASLGLALTTLSFAGTVVFTETGVGSGSIGAITFNDAAFTLTEIGDTSSRTLFDIDGTFYPGVYYIPGTSASISISGLGTFSILSPMLTFGNQPNEAAGMGAFGPGGPGTIGGQSYLGDILDLPSAAFGSWDMLTSIGPISGTGESFTPTFLTTGGSAVLNSVTGDTEFTATVVPEPTSNILLLSGMLVMAFVARKHNFKKRA